METLTLRQKKVFEFIMKYKREHDGNSPTIREICAGCDITSTSLVHAYLNALEKKGWIEREGRHSIKVWGGRWIWIAPA